MEIEIHDQPFNEKSFVVPTMGVHDLSLEDVHDEEHKSFPTLWHFAGLVQRKYPWLSFATERENNSGWHRGLHRVYVYMPQHCYTLGAIGYGTFLDESQKEDTRTYTVWSPHIQNNRYNTGSQIYMKTTDKLERGVNNVKFIRPLTPANYMQRSVYALHDHYTDEISDRRRIVTDARSEITGSARYFDDLIGAYRQWVMYKSDPRLDIKPYEYSEALADRIDTYLATAEESEELLQNVTSDMYQVRTTEDGFEVNRLDLQLANGRTSYYDTKPAIIHPVQTYKGDELPRSIANKLGVLDMTHAETDQQDIKFILGVGYTQIKGHLYYVTA